MKPSRKPSTNWTYVSYTDFLMTGNRYMYVPERLCDMAIIVKQKVFLELFLVKEFGLSVEECSRRNSYLLFYSFR